MNILVGDTGFVGGNICRSAHFDRTFHSTNIQEAYGMYPDLLIYAGVRAEKYLANANAEEDWNHILQAEKNIKEIHPKKLVLISTIDVLSDVQGTDEDTIVDEKLLQPYGLHRYWLEQRVRSSFSDALIIRLPALFGVGLKKNFLYDIIHCAPTVLSQDLYSDLVQKNGPLDHYYYLDQNKMFRKRILSMAEEKQLRLWMQEAGFTAAYFTDSRAVFQFYSLERLWDDIGIALENDLKLWHAATEPLNAAKIYMELTAERFINEVSKTQVYYDYRTKYDALFGGQNGYIELADQVLSEIHDFAVEEGLYEWSK